MPWVPSREPEPAAALPPLHPDLSALPGQGRVVVAFSGGADSMCLLHQSRLVLRERGLIAIHVDHGLDRGSAARATRAVELAAAMGVDCQVERVQVRRSGSIEANARDARYRALEAHIGSDGVLMTAHHADDLAETMILRLLRGAGAGGLAGIPRVRRHASGWLVRPLLGWNRRQILRYLDDCELNWIRDPANELAAMDRNFIRHEIMPLLSGRFPGAVRALNRSARLNRAALDTLAALAEADVRATSLAGGRLDLPGLERLTPFRRAEALRRWCIDCGHPPPPGARLEEFIKQIEQASPDRRPELRWERAVLRRHAGALWLETRPESVNLPWRLGWDGRSALELPAPSGRLELSGAGPALDLSVESGSAGEKLRLTAGSGQRRVKDLMNEHRIPPWQRECWPRIYQRGSLVAVGRHWLDFEFAARLKDSARGLVWHSELFGS